MTNAVSDGQRPSKLAWWLALVALAQTISRPVRAEDPESEPIPAPRTHAGPDLRIVELWGRDTHGAQRIALTNANDLAGSEAVVDVWPPSQPSLLWIRVSAAGAASGSCYGPGRPDGPSSVRLSSVLTNGAAHGARELEVRAFLASQPVKDAAACERAFAASDQVSRPILVTVPRVGTSEPGAELAFRTVNGDTLGPSEPPVVGPEISVQGSCETPGASCGRIYVLVALDEPDRYRVYGPALVHGKNFSVSKIWLGSELSRTELVAVRTDVELGGPYVSGAAWHRLARATSAALEVLVDAPGNPCRLSVDSVIDGGKARPVSGTVDLGVERIETLGGVQGTVKDCAAPLWLGVGNGEGRVVRLFGPIAAQNGRWSSALPSARELAGGKIDLFVVASHAVGIPGPLERRAALERALAVSNTVPVRISKPAPAAEPPAIALDAPAADGSFEGTVGDAPAGATLYVRLAASGCAGLCFLLSPEAVIHDGRFRVPVFPALSRLLADGAARVFAVTSEAHLPSDSVDAELLTALVSSVSQGRSVRMSGPNVPESRPFVEVVPETAAESVKASSSTANLLPLVLLLALAGAAFYLLERRCRLMSLVFGFFATRAGRKQSEIGRQLAPLIAERSLGAQLLGVVVLAAIGSAVVFYAPVYQKVVASVLGIPKVMSLGITVGLMTFSALAGVLLENVGGLLWPSKDRRGIERAGRGFIALGAVGLLGACTLLFPIVQAFIYVSYYVKAAPAVWLAFGGGALLMCVTETFGAFVGMRLGFGMVAWCLLGLLLRLPFALVAFPCELLCAIAERIGSAESPPREPKPEDRASGSYPRGSSAPAGATGSLFATQRERNGP